MTLNHLLAILVLALAGCGEHAYYPNLAPLADTGVADVPLVCGAPGTGLGHEVEIASVWDGAVQLNAVDESCAERSIGQLSALETQVFSISDTDALAAYATTPSGSIRIASRPAVSGPTSTWVIP